MLKINSIILILTIFLFVFIINSFAQEADIVPYLKQIENGKKNEVAKMLPELKKENPGDPSVMFLEGVLTENGQQAVAIYNTIVNQYPKSRYADAALYRIYAYYYALGIYSTAKEKLKVLKQRYPGSPYIQIAEKNLPSENQKIASEQDTGDSTKVTISDGANTGENKSFKYTIQAGAFSVLANAQSMEKSFRDSGFFSRIEEKVVAGTTFHVVYVGKFASEREANKALKSINAKFNVNGRVISTN